MNMAFRYRIDEKDKQTFEEYLRLIDTSYIEIDEEERQRNEEIISSIVGELCQHLSQETKLGGFIVKRVLSGSVSEDLKITNADEYDFNLVLTMPPEERISLKASELQGFVTIQMDRIKEFEEGEEEKEDPKEDDFKFLDEIVDNRNFLSTEKFLISMKTFIRRIFINWDFKINIKGSCYEIEEQASNGPVYTFLCKKGKNFEVSVDLAPCFELPGRFYPEEKFIQNPYPKEDFLIVPKSPMKTQMFKHRNWRLSLPTHEANLMQDLKLFKPTLKLFKLFCHSRKQYKMKSYFIKCMFFNSFGEKSKDEILDMWSGTGRLGDLFVEMLNDYIICLIKGEIRYYWNPGLNLIEDFHRDVRNTYKIDTDANFLQAVLSCPKKLQHALSVEKLNYYY